MIPLLAFVQFAVPAVLGGLLVVAAPLLIHFLLRPRPKRVLFPAVAFLHPALASGQRAQRLRNLWLLLVRVLLLACIVLILAGPTCAPVLTGGIVDEQEPIACVLIVDDSWSMRYQLDGENTLLNRARDAALDFVRAAGDWPHPSTLALVWADPARPVVSLSTDYAPLRTQLREAAPSEPHAAGLNHALREAARLLQNARQSRRRVVIFTDQAAHAWADVAPGALTGIENVSVTVRSVLREQRTNIALTGAAGPLGRHPETSPVPVGVTLSAAGLDATCSLVARDADRVIERIGPMTIPAGSARDVTLLLPPRPSGVHALTLDIEPGDRLGFDQSRYVVYETSPRPVVWLVEPGGTALDADLTVLLLRNLLAPDTLEADQQLVTLRRLAPAELALTAGTDADQPVRREADLIVIPAGVELNEAARQAVRGQAESGATVLLLPASRDDADWPGLRRLLARSVVRIDTLDAVTGFAWESGSSFAGVSIELDELTRTAVRRRVVLGGLEAGVAVEARYADGLPAIVSARRGRGWLVLLTTSPDPAWSELGMRAAGLLTWLHELLNQSLGSSDAVAEFTAGESTRHSFGSLPGRGNAWITRVTDPGGELGTRRVSAGEPDEDWPATGPGVYAVRSGRSIGPAALYAVNWPAAESDLRSIAADPLATLLGVESVELVGEETDDDQSEQEFWARLFAIHDAARVLPFALLALVLLELFMGNRGRSGDASREA